MEEEQEKKDSLIHAVQSGAGGCSHLLFTFGHGPLKGQGGAAGRGPTCIHALYRYLESCGVIPIEEKKNKLAEGSIGIALAA